MSPSPIVQRLAFAAIAAVLIAGVIVIAVGNGSGSKNTAASSQTTTTQGMGSVPTSVASGSPGCTPGATCQGIIPALPTTAPAGGGSSGTAGTSSATPTTPATYVRPATGTPSTPSQPKATGAGTYVYTLDYSSGSGGNSGSATVNEKVAREASASDETRESVNDSSAQYRNADQTSEVSWKATGFYLRSQTFNTAGGSYQCAWNPPVEALVLPLAVDKSWTFKSTCHFTAVGQPITLNLTGSAKVSGIDRVTVGPDTVNVWVIDATIDIQGTSPSFNFSAHNVSTQKLEPRQGVVVTANSTSTIKSSQGNATTTEQRQLHSLHPTP